MGSYGVWALAQGRDDEEEFDASNHAAAAQQWCAWNWDADDDETVDVAVIDDETKEVRVYTMERHVEYEEFLDPTLTEQLKRQLAAEADEEEAEDADG
ncbi:MAG TPA: hypothetical protein VFX59_29850 [Polyangiales bacterium]|nr:hypothetical protein [Polyangiales bacterium]